MSYFKKIKMRLVILVILALPGIASAASLFTDPGIPDGEVAIYVSRIENVCTTIEDRVDVKKEEGREIYEITSTSEIEERRVKLARSTMSVLYTFTRRKFPGAVVESEVRIFSEKPMCEKDEIKLADFSPMLYVLRGFPFGKVKYLKIGGFGEKKKTYMSIKYIKVEKVKVKFGTINCYRLELGMEGFWSGLFPKVNIWYSVDPPHYLVRYEGIDGPPGSPKRTMELVEYIKVGTDTTFR